MVEERLRSEVVEVSVKKRGIARQAPLPSPLCSFSIKETIGFHDDDRKLMSITMISERFAGLSRFGAFGP